MSNNPKDASDKKDGTYQPLPVQYDYQFKAIKMDPFANNDLIAQNGILCMHYMAIPDVIHQKIEGDLRTSFDDSEEFQFENREDLKRENGFIYIPKKPVYIVFTSNNKDMRYTPAGLYSDSGAYSTINRWYKDTEETVRLAEYDKLIPCEPKCEFYSTNWQKFQHNNAGVDRMQFPVIDVDYLIDSDGVFYQKNLDFEISDGSIRWISSNRPGLDNLTGKGKICSIRYIYKPYFYVKTVLHDFRTTPIMNQMGQAEVKRGPMQAVLQADWVFLDVRRKAEESVDQQLLAPDTDNTGDR